MNHQRGLVTDLETVAAALDAIAATQQPVIYDQRTCLLSINLQPNGRAILSCRVVECDESGRQGDTLATVATADADSFELPSDLAAALAAVRQFVAGV